MKSILAIFLLCLTLLPAASRAAANEEVQPSNFLPPAASEREREPRISRDQASDIVRENVPNSRVINIRRDSQNWRVRVDQEGNVSDVLVNTESGRVSRSDRE